MYVWMEMMNLLNLSAAQLKNMSKQEVHEEYKNVLGFMLMDFYIECSNHFDSGNDITMQQLTDYIAKWLDKKIIKKPHKEWNPGDEGK
jgi:hypothetical protein